MEGQVWFKIGEAADSVGVTPRDIRYWEKLIPEIRPRRSTGNLRYYHVDDLPKLKAISKWVRQGHSVADCRELLSNGYVTRDLGLLGAEELDGSGKPGRLSEQAWQSQLTRSSQVALSAPVAPIAPTGLTRAQLQPVVDSLKELLAKLSL